ncbi:MAG: NADAR family protein [Methyloceanibacter sp.]
MTIRFFSKSDTYAELSNFAPSPIEINGEICPSVEHYYQARKFDDVEMQSETRAAAKPVVAKKLAQKYRACIRPGWDSMKAAVMERAPCAANSHKPPRFARCFS